MDVKVNMEAMVFAKDNIFLGDAAVGQVEEEKASDESI